MFAELLRARLKPGLPACGERRNMTPLSPLENVMAKIGPLRPLGAWRLAAAPDVRLAIAQIGAVRRRLSNLRCTLKNAFGWNWRVASDVGEADALAGHILVVRDGALRGVAGLELLLAKVSRLAFAPGLPPWRAIIVNPGPCAPEEAKEALHAFLFHFDHTIADGIRVDRFVRSMQRWGEEDGARGELVEAVAARIRATDAAGLDLLAQAGDVTPRQTALVTVTGRAIRDGRRPGQSSSGRILSGLAHALAQPGCHSPARHRSGWAMEILGEKATGGAAQGNYALARIADATPLDAASTGARSAAFRLLRRAGPWRFNLASPLPSLLVRWIVRAWYRRFDVFLSLIPSTMRPFAVAGAQVVAIFGIAPMVGETPVAATVFRAFGDFFVCLQKGEGLQCDISQIASSFADATVRSDLSGKDARTAGTQV